MNYEKDIIIDETALDLEWLEQAALAIRYGRHWADCQSEVMLAEENVKVVRAELIKMAHEDPDVHLDGAKPTGPVVEAFYRNHSRHKKAKERWIAATHEANMADIARKEISLTRKARIGEFGKITWPTIFRWPQYTTRHRTNEKRATETCERWCCK
jgi:hypothetical protein